MPKDDVLDELVCTCFLQPQLVLSERGQDNKGKRLDNVSMLAVKPTSDMPMRAPTMRVFALQLRIGFIGDWKALGELDNGGLTALLGRLKTTQEQVGCWTLIHDVVGSKEAGRPPWRVIAEVGPASVVGCSWLEFGNGRKVLGLDVDGAAVFFGRAPKK